MLLGLAPAYGGRGAALHAQGRAVPDSAIARRLALPLPPALEPFGALAVGRLPASAIAAIQADSVRRALAGRERVMTAAWLGARDRRVPAPTVASFAPPPRVRPEPSLLPRDTTVAGLPSQTLPGSVPVTDYADLALKLNTRLELKGERAQTSPCLTIELASLGTCRSPLVPNFNFQFNVLSGGVVADRVHVDVDYDSQREFDASNNLSIYYQGKPNEVLQRLEVGNVTFAPPPSRFITAGIPSGNYGVQALGQVGPMRFRAIAAQQKGQLVHDARFTVGDRTERSESRDIDDYQIEPRRFFFTVDPALFPGYPSVDILNHAQLASLRAQLPANQRPAKVRVYRLQIGSQPANPNGPRFIVNGLTSANRGEQPYELLREGVDYYMDPSLLWFALVRTPSLDRDRIVVAYTAGDGAGVVDTTTGGTPDVEYIPATQSGHGQYANLVYDHSINPGDPAFRREIRSVYRIGGEEVRRNTINLRVVAGAAGDQEKPSGGSAQTYLQMFGLAQSTNPAAFDAENRVWPRPSDPNVSIAPGGGSSRVIGDYFVVLPSVQPFRETTKGGRVEPGNLTNDPIYTTPDEYLYSTQHPTAVYRLQLRYQTEGGGDQGSLMLGAVQLRRNSERISVDGVQLVRDLDYTVDYELGRVSFARPDTLFPRPRTVTVQYEENPVFQNVATNVFGIASTFAAPAGEVTFTAMAQGQKTLYTRPPLGFEPASSLVAGVSGNWSWDAPLLSDALAKLPLLSERPGQSRIALQAELATSRPQPNSVGQAWIENFAGEGGIGISTLDPSWFLSSRPLDTPASNAIRPNLFDPNAAASLVWQTNVVGADGVPARYVVEQIDPTVRISYNGTVHFAEQVLWLSLLPDTLGWARPGARWRTPAMPLGARRWRSIRTVLSPSGADLSQVEQLEFFAMVDTRSNNRDRNPTFVIDLGDVSENTLAISPDSLVVPGAGVADSTFGGRRVVGLDSLDTERDPITRSFSASLNDVGIAPDVVDRLKVVSPAGTTTLTNVPICQAEYGIPQRVGDQRTNCTVRNNRLDEEDIDLDYALNYKEAQRGSESFFRYTVDLAALSQDTAAAPRGRCFSSMTDTLQKDAGGGGPFCWIRVRVPLDAARDTVNAPLRRRIRALRLTMVAGATVPNGETITTPIARFRLAGPLWLKRADAPLAGVGGDSLAVAGPRGSVSVATLSTQDPGYVHPPGLGDDADTKVSKYQQQAIQTNERSLRVLATSVPALSRAEAYYRFPEGSKNFLGYGELRVWARGGNTRGWGTSGDLDFFIRIGRDASNFYLYHTRAYGDAWTDVKVDFAQLQALRARIQDAYLRGTPAITCTGTDSALVAKTARDALLATNQVYAACANGYIAYTVSPGVTPPNLAAVQELAVGMLRVDSAQTFASVDTLDLWVDDIRLRDVEKTPGYAGQIGLEVRAGGIADIRIVTSRRDAYFRQLAEQPSYVGAGALDLTSTVRLEKLLPASLGMSLPVTIAYSGTSADPVLLERSDLRADQVPGLRTPKTSATSYAVSARRLTPLGNPILGAILDNVTLNGALSTASARSEYQDGGAKNWSATVDYAVAAEPRARAIPAWVQKAIGILPPWLSESELGRAIRGASLRWNPSQIRFSSGLARTTDDRTSFLKPAAAGNDTGQRVGAETHLWRNVFGVELRPVNALSLRWDATQTRDLRNYGDAPGDSTAAAARRERGSLFGSDIGLERDRQMSAAATFAPPVASWLKPRLDLASTFTFVRDPNARALIDARRRDTTFVDSIAVLPRRFGNTQTATAAAQLDIQTMGRVFWQRVGFLRALSNAITPIDVSVSRSLISAFDDETFSPSLGYQLALGGPTSFRSLRGRPATTAGLTNTLSGSSSLVLPFGFTFLPRYSLTTTRSWYRRSDDQQDAIDGLQRDYPDLTLRWSFVPGSRGASAFFGKAVRSVSASAGLRNTRVTALTPQAGGEGDLRASRIRVYPVNATILWPFGDLSTTGGLSWSVRDDSLPGSATHGFTNERSADVARSWKLPSSWNARSPLRTRLGWQEQRTKNTLAGSLRNLTDNARRVFSLSADTDLNETMSFSLQGSRTATMDRNYNRRFNQTVITAALQMQFFSGPTH